MTCNSPMTAADRQRWYWMKECERLQKEMKKAQEANAPDKEVFEKKYKRALETFKSL